MSDKMGYQGLLYYGAKGSQANQQITRARDIDFDVVPTIGDTTERGTGASVPIETGEAVTLGAKLNFNMKVNANDTILPLLLAAAATGLPVALRYIRQSGATGLDADCVIGAKQGAPLKGEQTVDISVESLSACDRTPILNG